MVSFGLLALVAYRSLARSEASWDLLGLVVLGGLVGTTYRLRQRVVSRRWVWVFGLTFALALVIGAVLAVAART